MTTRTDEVTALLSRILAAQADGGPLHVVVDGPIDQAATFADALAVTLAGHGSLNTVAVGDGSAGGTVIRLRTGPRGDDRRRDAPIVVDFSDPSWPIVRHIDAALVDPDTWHIPESRAFFAPRAATWDTKFGDDLPAYAAAVTEAALPTGATVVDVGCGTGRALPALRAAVGSTGAVLGVDITPEMLSIARRRGDFFALALADARHLPLADRSVDAVFAAGLVQHLPDSSAGLAELARVTRPGGTLVVFHPSGRRALAARHGRTVRPDEPLSPDRIGPLLAAAGWELTRYDDSPHRFLATATRAGAPYDQRLLFGR